MQKALWVTSLLEQDAKTLIAHANASGATLVCVRSTSAVLPHAIAALGEAGIETYAWRWPAVRKSPTDHAPHHEASMEAAYVATTLIPAGLAGYIVDPESDGPGQVDDWNSATHRQLAIEFCATIHAAAAASGRPFHFGVTSGCEYPTNHADIPWDAFVSAADALYPQVYWRADIHDACQTVHGGTPQASYEKAIAAWTTIANGKPIVAIAGELDCIGTAHVDELSAFGALVAEKQEALHFYADSNQTAPEIHAAIKAM